MEIELKRIYKGIDYTIGKLYVNSNWVCDTLEDTVRILHTETDKIPKQTAIPMGRYQVILSYSKGFDKVLPELLNVPFFKGIRIHAGNDKEDTEGCILVGENKVKGKVINSKKTIKKLIPILQKAIDNNEKIYINIY